MGNKDFDYSFKKEERLKSKKQFDELFAEGVPGKYWEKTWFERDLCENTFSINSWRFCSNADWNNGQGIVIIELYYYEQNQPLPDLSDKMLIAFITERCIWLNEFISLEI